MKKTLLLCSSVLAISLLHAQIAPVAPKLQSQTYGFKSKPAARIIAPFNSNLPVNNYVQLKQVRPNIDNMPVNGLGQITLTPQGNSVQGFDVYAATPDNMPVLKPDATYLSTMPIVGNTTAQPDVKR